MKSKQISPMELEDIIIEKYRKKMENVKNREKNRLQRKVKNRVKHKVKK